MNTELKKFDSLIDQSHIQKVANDCWIIGKNPKHLLSIMIHGNETLGLHLINYLLEQPSQKPFGLILGNREATLINKRFVERDLNRSFLEKNNEKFEENRAKEIETFASTFQYVLDIHQTSHDSEREFFLCRNHKESLQMAEIFPSSPLVFLREPKMSSEGEGFGSFALKNSLPFLTVELGKMGFNQDYFDKGLEIIHNFLDFEGEVQSINLERSCYLFSKKVIKQSEDDLLVSGLTNLQPVSKGKNLLKNREFLCPIEGYTLFPKYGDYQKFSIDLCQILEKKKLKDVVSDDILKPN